jgi:nucleoside-diphosphate-sugar epimerase
MSKYLVTGGAGFIGSHIVGRLLKEGHFVRVLDNFSSGKEENLIFVKELRIANYELIKADIRDKDTCLKATEGIDFISHQAALRSVPKSLDNPEDYNEVNIGGTLNMLEAALKNKVKAFVFASSSSVYGEAERFPQKETDLPNLISPYALTKLSGEYYCSIFYKIYGLNTISLRYFNVFGPRQALDDEYAVVIPKFINCMLKESNPPVHGNGRQTRDFTYIDNVVEANLLALQAKGIGGEVFNIACGKENSVLDITVAINKILNKNIKPVFEPSRKGDVARTLADISKAKRLLKFNPKVDFEEGLRRTIEWFAKKRLH